MRSQDIITPDWGLPLSAVVGALSTTRKGGVSIAPYDDGDGGGGLNLGDHVGDAEESVRKNRASLAQHLPDTPAWLRQVHGVEVVNATSMAGTPRADASIATRPGTVCAVLTADCLPVLLSDTRGRVVGAAHAGWRGLVGGVLQNTVRSMRSAGADEILAWLGPAIGPHAFEVGMDVREAFAAANGGSSRFFEPIAERPGKYLADIYGLARRVLHEVGVSHVLGGELCTVSDPSRFYSYRRDGVTGRMASLIWVK